MAQQQLDDVDAMLAELGIDPEAAAAPAPQIATGPRPGVSAGPGAGMSRGPGAMSAGPGGMSRGPGAMSAGPGAAAAASAAASPGMMFTGPTGISAGPGGFRGGMANGPGARPPGAAGIVPATHTPDGRAITHTGPPCAGCGNMIIGPVMNALDKTWHPEHFVCVQCNRTFPDGNFVEHEGKAYCEDDYNELFGARCAHCMKPITDTCISAIGRVYHPDHFFCAGCGCELRGQPYKEHEGEPYCVSCKAARTITIEISAGICGKCKKNIVGEYIILNGQRMHPEHFKCEECGCDFKGGNCHEYEGKLYCYPDYLKLLKSICAHCGKPIIGRSITALAKVWHPEHFMCFTCKEPFGGSTFYEHEGKAYCEPHYLNQFGKMCHRCQKPIADGGIVALGKHYHKDHFVCTGCEKPLGKDIYDFESKAMCKSCYEKLPKEVRKRIEKKKEGEKKASKEREKQAEKEAKEAEKAAKKAAKAAKS